jgi:hypothetical protein
VGRTHDGGLAMGQNAPMQIPAGALALVSAALVLVAPAQAQTVKILLTSVATVQILHDTPPKHKVNKGDWVYFKDLLLNRVAQFGKKKNQPVAFDVGTVTYTSAVGRKLKCLVTFPGVGTITYGGVVVDHADGTTTFPIMQGTGGFKHAKGTVTFGPGGSTTPNTFIVTVPGTPIALHGGGVA